MASSNQVENEGLALIKGHLSAYESLREYTQGMYLSAFGLDSDATSMLENTFSKGSRPSFGIGLTDKRLILVELKGNKPTGGTYSIPLTDVKNLESPERGAFYINLSHDKLGLDVGPGIWYSHALQMIEAMPTSSDIQTEEISSLEKADTYMKLGLPAQAQHEIELAKSKDPYVVQDDRYKALMEVGTRKVQENAQEIEALKTPLRIGTGILFINALFGLLILVVRLLTSGLANLEFDNFISPIINVVIGVNLWALNRGWQKRTVWWAVIGLVLFGGQSLLAGDFFGLIIQFTYDASLILLLAGKPSKARTIIAVIVFVLGYLIPICLGTVALILLSSGVVQ